MRALFLPLAFALMSPSIGEAQVARAITFGEYLDSFQTEGPRRLVAYCALEAPSLATELDGELRAYRMKVTAATEPLRKRNEADLTKPVPEDVQAAFDDIAQKMVAAAKEYESNAYCSWLLRSLRSTTVESLQTRIEQANERYEAITRQRAQSRPK